ncbi:NAD(P)H-hydrate dehydratase [Rubrobacter calidifluminis]|uniref:NAD(P)H-hydrate dehydratase n=1 Tax=Rubrobacter calidifluminis TaxID=1392640 RepID=UPI00235FEBA3|nr:NAD(P)H-hydrate dehydratase [Rubrobacter calidifluminis]
MRLYTAAEMSRADENAQSLGIPGVVLMERAGSAMARLALERFSPERALVVAGGGNNGGDGFVVARELHRAGVEVVVCATREEYRGDPETNLRTLQNLGVRFCGREELADELAAADLVVDALLGTGFSGEVREDAARIIREINASGARVFSVDVPSGVDGSTGEVGGEAVRAWLTACAHAVKVGCVVSPGCDHAGEVVAVDIGVPVEAEVEPSVVLGDREELHGLVPRTAQPAHKYSAGTLLVVAGSRRMTGAAVMSVLGAQRAGCGIVFLVVPAGAAAAVDARLTEAIVSGAPEDGEGHLTSEALGEVLERAERASAVVVGPAIGRTGESRHLVEGILREVEVPVLLDADGVTSLAGSDALARREAPTVITPHAGELGRILDVGAGEISARRLHHAREAARRFGCCVLLKGNDTIVAEGERVSVNPTGSVALATAGTGDVLSGVIGALLSRGMGVYDAARVGAWAHGRAAHLWLEETGWPAESMVATDLVPLLPRALRELV